jgi:hypothetical protein
MILGKWEKSERDQKCLYEVNICTRPGRVDKTD